MEYIDNQIAELEDLLFKTKDLFGERPADDKVYKTMLMVAGVVDRLKAANRYQEEVELLEELVRVAETERGQPCPVCSGRGRVPFGQ